MGRALFGLIKGLIIGGGTGYGLLRLTHGQDGIFSYLACGLVGALVGLVCGRPPWRAETIWTPVLKMLFGVAVGMGLYALGHHFLPDAPKLTVQGLAENLTLRTGSVLACLIGALYGIFVEVDDGGSAREERQLAA